MEPNQNVESDANSGKPGASRGTLLAVTATLLAVIVAAGVYIMRGSRMTGGASADAQPAVEPGPDQLAQADRDKLAALENAYKNGVLSKEEYEAKKREILSHARASTPQPDPAQLAALENAYKSGVINKDEYEAKKRALYAAAAQRGKQGKGAEQEGAGQMRGPAASGPLPNRALPEGYQATDQPDGGRILAATFSGNARSAAAVLRGINGQLGGYFDAVPQINSAVRDPSDQNVLAAFDARIAGAPVCGMTIIGLVGGGGAVAVLFDHAGSVERTLPNLLQQLRALQVRGSGGGPAGGTANVPLQQTPCPDGKCSVGLPQGWRISGWGNAAVDVMGPNGEALDLGIYMPVFTPNAMVQSSMVPVSPYVADAVRAAVFLTEASSRISMAQGQPPIQNIQVLEAMPSPPPLGTGQAAWILSRFEQGGRRYLSFGIANSAPIDYTSWAVYSSSVRAPEEIFRQELPLLLRVWGSWQISGKVIQERMQAAAESMRQTQEILRSTIQNQSNAFERANKGWDYYIRGVEIVRYEPTGEHSKPLDRDWADWLHKQDPLKFTVLPASQYNKND